MGKNKRHGTWKNKKDKAKQPQVQENYDNSGFTKENKAFEAYYKLQLGQEFSNEAEFNKFKSILREKLPVVFRINENVPNFGNFLQKLKSSAFMEKLLTGNTQNSNTENPEGKAQGEESKETDAKKLLEQLELKNVPWYPRELVWQLNIFRQELRKNKSFQNLHKFINEATVAGLISRQELVSMLPPLLLDIQSTDIIFDMCAAPGSKTAQMLEILSRDEFLGKGLTQGAVVANDINYNRAAMLIHQVQRISTVGMMVVNHSAQHFPTFKYSQDPSPEVWRDPNNKFYFDKVLADVPCTGDGAIRKLPMKWAKWTGKDGLTLHHLQLQILIRAIQLAKPGGLVMYSTCSINPIEDEAVVTEIFRRCEEGSIELVDIREKLPGLIARPGLSNWSVCEDKEKATEEIKEDETTIKQEETAEKYFHIYKSYDQVPEDHKGFIYKSMFPESEERMRDVIKIQNTLRIMPHDQNSGGFYLALIRKKEHVNFNVKGLVQTKENLGELANDEEGALVPKKEENNVIEETKPSADVDISPEENKEEGQEGQEDEGSEEGNNEEDEKEEEKVTEQKGEGEQQVATTKRSRRNREVKKKVTFDKFEPEEWEWIKSYYGIKDDTLKDFMVQQTVGDRKVYMISPAIKKILDLKTYKTIINKLNMGAKALFKNRDVFLDNQYPYRLCQDAIQTLFPFFTKRKIRCSVSDFMYMVEKLNVRFNELPSDELKQRVKEEGQGCFVLYAEKEGPIQETDCLVCLCHGASVSVMVSRELVQSLKLRYNNVVV